MGIALCLVQARIPQTLYLTLSTSRAALRQSLEALSDAGRTTNEL